MSKLIILLAVYCSFMVSQAQNFPETLKKQAGNYRKANPYSVKLFFSQPMYAPGDTAFYSASLLNSIQSKPEAGRRLLDMAVWDDKGEAVLRSRILLLNGFGKSQLVIPSKFKPGRYALTASMYQSGVVSFQQEFLIVGNMELKSTEFKNFEAFVEGGHLIEGIPNYVMVRANHKASIRLKAAGKVVREVMTDSFGWAEFRIIPAKESYVVEFEGKDLSLPATETGGYALHYRDERDPSFEVRQVRGSSDTYLVLTSRNEIASIIQLSSSDTLSRVSLPEMTRGIGQAVILDSDYHVLASRWFMTGKASWPEVTLDKDTFLTRQQVDFKLSPGQNAAQVSVRVLKKDLFSAENDLSPAGPSINGALLARSDDAFPWSGLPGVKEGNQAPSDRYLTISGRSIFTDTGKPVPDSTMLVLFLQNKLFGYEAMLYDGQFKVPLVFDVEGDESVFYFATHRKRDLDNITLKLDSALQIRGVRANAFKPGEKVDPYGLYNTKKKVIDRSFRYFSATTTNEDHDPNARFIEELGGVDVTVETKSYVAFSSMSEVMREILPGVEHRTIKGREVVRLYTTHKRPTNFTGPLYVIDGVLTKNPRNFLDIKPTDVLYIKIVKDYSKLRHLGLLADNGVILVRTKSGEPSFVQQDVFAIQGIPVTATSKLYAGTSISNSRIPDLRPCLYFNPSVTMASDNPMTLSFFTSDDVGDYVIQVSGTNIYGEPYHAEQIIHVVLNK